MERETALQTRHDADDVRQANRVSVFTGVMMFWAVVFVPIYALLGDMKSSQVLVASCLIGTANLIMLRLGVTPRICGNVLCSTAFFVYSALAIYCGGRWAPTTIWYVSMPVLSLVVCGTGWACFWTIASLVAIVVFTLLDHYGLVLPTELGSSEILLLHALGLVGLVLCFYALAYLMMRFERQSRKILSEANRWLQLESSLDALTQIANRRCFDQILEQEWDRHIRGHLPLTVALIDLDYFKEFNDIYGHLAGDKVLRRIAGAIQSGIRRREDFVARFGGEEFVVILPITNERLVVGVVERIREEVEALNVQHPGSSASSRVTISIGVATTVPMEYNTHLDLLRRADEALYLAKDEGRDRVIYANDICNIQEMDAAIARSSELPQAKRDGSPVAESQPVTQTLVGHVADVLRTIRKQT